MTEILESFSDELLMRCRIRRSLETRRVQR
jgi:hypothetical protein